MNLLILQQRARKAGAQNALLRILKTSKFSNTNTLVILGEQGWLSDEFDKSNIQYKVIPFPSSRSLMGKLFLNHQFTKKVLSTLHSFSPNIVLANDHCECLLTLNIAQKAKAKTAAFLRSSELTQTTFNKYRCPEFDLLLPIGDTLFDQVSSWSPSSNAHVTYDGLEKNEFHPISQKSPTFPTRWLIIGGAGANKGWQDFAEAISIAEQNPDFPTLTCDFTSDPPQSPDNDMKLDLPRRATFNFLGRVPSIVESAKNYKLSVHPSQEETFGLAAAEIIAAGQPLLASTVGVLARIHAHPDMTFPPKKPKAQAQCYLNLFEHWKSLDLHLQESQNLLKKQFLIDIQVEQLHQLLSNLA